MPAFKIYIKQVGAVFSVYRDYACQDQVKELTRICPWIVDDYESSKAARNWFIDLLSFNQKYEFISVQITINNDTIQLERLAPRREIES